MSEIASLISSLGGRVIGVQPAYIKLTNSASAAIFLSQAIYWHSKMEGWFFKTQADWEQEICLSAEAQLTARKKLVKLGFLKEERRGIPAKTYYLVDIEAVAYAVLNLRKTQEKQLSNKNQGIPESSIRETRNQETENHGYCNPATPDTVIRQPRNLLQKNTQEITQKNTTTTAAANEESTSSSGGGDLFFDDSLVSEEVKKQIVADVKKSQLSHEIKQAVLDELAGCQRLAKNGKGKEIANPIRYVAALVKRAQQGQFTKEQGIAEAKRRENLAKNQQAQAAARKSQVSQAAAVVEIEDKATKLIAQYDALKIASPARAKALLRQIEQLAAKDDEKAKYFLAGKEKAA